MHTATLPVVHVAVAPTLHGRLVSKGQRIRSVARFPGVPFVVTARCVADGKSLGRHDAHAHTATSSPWFGLVCVSDEKHMSDEILLAHEVAHLLNASRGGKDSHGPGWRRALREILPDGRGHAEGARYKSRRRKRVALVHADGTVRVAIAPIEATGSVVLKDKTIEVSEELHLMFLEADFTDGSTPYVLKLDKG